MPSEALAQPGRATMRPWQFYLTVSFLAAAAAVWLTPPASPVALLFISLAIGAAGACAAALHAVLAALSGRSRIEREVIESQRAALEREKLLALRAIKDLQFDVAMGKVSAADAAPMEARLRERAAGILRALDAREDVRANVEADLARRQAAGGRLQAPDPRLQAPGAQAVTCPACGTANDFDAKFCKSCGSKL